MSQQVEPIVVSGGQGSGKTTFLREQHARFDGPSIIMTPKKNERKAASNPPHRIRKSSCTYPEDIHKAREWALSRDETVQVIVDECQNAPTFIDGNGPLRDMLHEDREGGVKTVIATQTPSDLRTDEHNYGPVQQCDYWVWCGPLKTWHSGFFNANGMGDMKPLMPTKKYEYVVITPIESLSPKERIVHRGTTNRKYG